MERSAEREPAERLAPWRILLERDRQVALVLLLGVTAIAWGYLMAGAGMPGMQGMDPDMVMAPEPWSPAHATAVVLMWWVMMAAMMLPSAAPAILLHHRIAGRQGRAGPLTAVFTLGYLLVWGSFSLTAALAHWLLDQAGLLTMAMASASRSVSGIVLIAAGLWQLTPAKRACLTKCQSPLMFFAQGWRGGFPGALRMGVAHGVYCLGCCWVLMALLFYGGIMNFAWIGGIALYVLLEKWLPAGHGLGIVAGLALIGWGAVILVLAA